MTTGHRVDIDLKVKACEMWAEGTGTTKISQEIGIPRKTIESWKRAKYPEDWNKKRSDRIAAKAKILEEEVLENYERTKVRHQKVLRSGMLALVKRIVQADPKDISIPTAVEGVQDFIDKEREIFMDLETLERIKSKTTGITMGVAAQTQEQKAMAFLTASWNEMHGNDGRTETKDGREPS